MPRDAHVPTSASAELIFHTPNNYPNPTRRPLRLTNRT